MSQFDELSGTSEFLLSEDVPDADALTNYADYVDNKSYHVDVKDEVCWSSEEPEQTPVREEQCDSSDASGDSDSALPSARGKKKRKGRAIKLKDEHLDLKCGWRDCEHRTSNLDEFVRHVSLHVPHLEVKMNEDQEGTGSIVYPRILPASSSTWQCNLFNHMLAKVSFCSLFRCLRSIQWLENSRTKHGKEQNKH
jgi:hypothetical protein